jgi:flavin reductase (DIM6/NTAB) family NADH-FMN oxidoreductase RutF
MHLDPLALSQADRYKLLIGAIVPRPIAFVSTISPAPDEHVNLAPFSFFNGVGSDPMTLLFCPANHDDGREKDTLRNAKPVSEGGQGEFVVNVVQHAYAAEMARCAVFLPPEDSEFAYSGLEPAPSLIVRPPRVARSPVSFECRTLQVVRLKPDAPGGGNIVIGQVVSIYLRDDIINQRHHLDPSALDLIGRMGGQTYCTTRERFELGRG